MTMTICLYNVLDGVSDLSFCHSLDLKSEDFVTGLLCM
jgi:hypothetical protein